MGRERGGGGRDRVERGRRIEMKGVEERKKRGRNTDACMCINYNM